MKNTTDALIKIMCDKNMSNSHHYKNTFELSLRLQSRIRALQDTIIKNDDILQSPTETIIAYYDESNSVHYDRDDEKRAIDSKPLPPLLSRSVDSAVELSLSKDLPPIPPKKTPATTTIDTPEHQVLPTIQHVKRRRYRGFLGFLTRTYLLHTIMVSRTLLSPYLYASRDTMTGQRKAVLKLIVKSTQQHGFQISFPPCRYPSPPSPLLSSSSNIDDTSLVPYLAHWLTYQPLLPLLVHAKHIFRQEHKLYIVYNHQLQQ